MMGPLAHLDHWPRGQRDITVCQGCGSILASEVSDDEQGCRFICGAKPHPCGWTGQWGEHDWEGRVHG
jgi:hypothetical protein